MSIAILTGVVACTTAPVGAAKRVIDPELESTVPASATEQLTVKKTILEEPEAIAMVSDKLEAIAHLLDPSPEPYFGARVPGPTCDRALLPSREHFEDARQISTVIHLFATEGKVYGTCSTRLDVLKSGLQWLYCRKTKTLFELKSFYPAANSWQLGPLATCRN